MKEREALIAAQEAEGSDNSMSDVGTAFTPYDVDDFIARYTGSNPGGSPGMYPGGPMTTMGGGGGGFSGTSAAPPITSSFPGPYMAPTPFQFGAAFTPYDWASGQGGFLWGQDDPNKSPKNQGLL